MENYLVHKSVDCTPFFRNILAVCDDVQFVDHCDHLWPFIEKWVQGHIPELKRNLEIWERFQQQAYVNPEGMK